MNHSPWPIRREALLWHRPPPQRVRGQAVLENYIAPTTGKPLEVQVHQSNQLVETLTVNCGPNGEYGISPTVSGPMTLKFRFHTSLWKAVNVDLGATPITDLDVNMTNGDVDRSNAVDIDDFLILAGQYELTPPTDPHADLNGDETVNIDDFLILAGNYERAGD